MALLTPDGTDGNTFKGVSQSFNNRIVAWGTTAPDSGSRTDKMLWFEPSPFPQPWEWDAGSNAWRSAPQMFTASANTTIISTASSFRVDIPLNDKSSGYIWSDEVWFSIVAGAAHNSSNYWRLELRTLNSNNTQTTLATWNTTSAASATLTRNNMTAYSYNANCWGFSFLLTKVGTIANPTIASCTFITKFVKL